MVEAKVAELQEYLQLAQKFSQTTQNVSDSMVRELVETKLRELERIWEEVGHDIQMINFLVDKIRSNIQEALHSSESAEWCLQGEIDDYIHTFKAQTDKING